MRKLHWSKLPPARIAGTLWQGIDPSRVKLETSELEALFAAPKDRDASQSKAAGAGASALVDDKVRFFDSKRANNIGIMMSQFRGIDVQGLVLALRRGDEEVLTLERVTQLNKFCPNPV